MKALFILSLTIVSLNAFSAEIGEDKKGECIYSNQSNNRDAKTLAVAVAAPVIKSEGASSQGK